MLKALLRGLTARPAGTIPATDGFNELHRCRYGLMLCNRHDLYIGRSLREYGEYCQAEADLLQPFLSAGDVVVDAGAHIGTLTLFFARAVGPQGLVHAFEPQRVIFQTLCANVALNSLANVQALQAAVGAAPGRIALDRPDYGQTNNFGGMELGQGADSAPLTTIDALELAYCRLIKIDVEGMEQAALEGAAQTLRRCRPLLYVENDRPEHSDALIAHIAALGYRLYWHVAPYFNPSNFNGRRDNVFGNMAARNMLCVPADVPVVAGLEPVLLP